MTHPIAGPCDSPNVDTVNKVPKVLPDIIDRGIERSDDFNRSAQDLADQVACN